MKRIIIFSIVATFLVLSKYTFALEWQPIAEITDVELKTIANASRQFPGWIYKDAKAFRVKHQVVIEILLKDGIVKYYAVGNSNDDFVANQDQTETKNTANLDKSTQEETALNLADEFHTIWVGKTGDELSPEELQKADSLMYAYISILKTFPELISNILGQGRISTFTIGSRGKRYLEAFQKLQPQLEPKDIVNFYDAFIAIQNGTKEDMPNDQEKMAAIEEIKNLLQKFSDSPIPSLSFFGPNTLREFRRLDPKFYLSLPILVHQTN